MPPWLYARPQGLEYHSIKIEGASPQDAAIITVSLSVRKGLMSHRLFECTTPLPIPADISDSTAASAAASLRPGEERSEARRVGKECVVRVGSGGRRIIKKKKEQ